MSSYDYQPTCQIPPEKLDAIYKAAFGFKRDGVLVEFGAHDGWHWSCTWGLAKIGWRCLYAEPVDVLYHECVRTHRQHPNVSVRRCCIGPWNGTATLGMAEYGASLDSNKNQFRCRQFTLDKFLAKERIPQRFDLLVIDVEGGEAGILAGFTLDKWLPKLVIIERPPEPNKFTEAGYLTVYEDWINHIYQRPT